MTEEESYVGEASWIMIRRSRKVTKTALYVVGRGEGDASELSWRWEGGEGRVFGRIGRD